MSAIELREVEEKAALALRAAEADTAASPVLVAVVREFAAKATKAIGFAGGERAWEAVVEVEQAGDSAKAAAEADQAAAEATTSAVLAAHLAICMLKASMAQTVG
ncbi:MAG: hypothetical protein LC792_00375 [Actinobacteria bacterium]|nr:hypothetical protein [Actinomycetota bacterium]